VKKSPLKRKTPLKSRKVGLKPKKLRVQGVSDTAVIKRNIQALLRSYAIERDGDCILRKYRRCNDPVLQYDHLITRANSATYADERLGVLICRTCHGWKHWHKEEYDALVRTILPKTRVQLWQRCEEASWRPTNKGAYDWKLEELRLKQLNGVE
jgi:hypothetical protein